MCYPNISGCGKGYVGPEKKAQEAGKVPDTTIGPSEPQLCDQSKLTIGEKLNIIVEKIGNVNPDKFKDIFDNIEVSQAKSLINDIIKTPGKDKGKIADLIRDFDKTTSKMDKGQLVEVAQHINVLMRDTNGDDDVLGSLMKSVLDKIDKPAKGRFAPPSPIWDEKLPQKPFPWDEKLPNDLIKPHIFDKLDDKFQHKKTLIVDNKVPDKDIF